jgi:hypothetical protein
VNAHVVEGRADGTVELRSLSTGALAWHGTVGEPISAPEGETILPPVGLAEGDGALAVPAQNTITIFKPVAH